MGSHTVYCPPSHWNQQMEVRLMTQSSYKLAGIALVCGIAVGLGGGITIAHIRDELAAETASSDAPQQHVSAESTDLPGEGTPLPTHPTSTSEPEHNDAITLQLSQPEPTLVVNVGGAVNRPGVYTFAEDARVHHGIAAAGDTTDNADLSDINIAARLMDNTSLYIPFQMLRHGGDDSLVARRTHSASETNPARYTRSGWAYGRPPGVPSDTRPAQAPETEPDPADDTKTAETSTSDLIDINNASTTELQELPGIGPRMAERIETYRQRQPFGSVEELTAVHGIGPKTLEAVRDLVVAR